jgi:hypothetical protein
MPSARHYSHLQDHIDFAGAELANWLRNNEEALGDLGRAAVKVFPQFRMWHEKRVARERGAVGPPGLEVSAGV